MLMGAGGAKDFRGIQWWGPRLCCRGLNLRLASSLDLGDLPKGDLEHGAENVKTSIWGGHSDAREDEHENTSLHFLQAGSDPTSIAHGDLLSCIYRG